MNGECVKIKFKKSETLYYVIFTSFTGAFIVYISKLFCFVLIHVIVKLIFRAEYICGNSYCDSTGHCHNCSDIRVIYGHVLALWYRF